jgi:hypothetical protein
MPRGQERGSLHLYVDSLSSSARGGGNEGQQMLDRLYSQAEPVQNEIDRAVPVFPAGSPEGFMPILAEPVCALRSASPTWRRLWGSANSCVSSRDARNNQWRALLPDQ